MSQEGSGQGEQAGDARGVPTGRERFTACLSSLSASPAPTDPVLRAPDTKTPSSEHRCSNPEIELGSPELQADYLPSEPPGKLVPAQILCPVLMLF